MQLIDTHVTNVTDGAVVVEFRGEGGELVSIRMSTAGVLDGDAAVRRAKEIMVQLTAFDSDSGGQTGTEPRVFGPG